MHPEKNNTPWTSYQIREIERLACVGNAGNVYPDRLQNQSLVSDADMHHGTWVTHVPWCMSGSLTRGGRENVPVIPGACEPAILHTVRWRYNLIKFHADIHKRHPILRPLSDRYSARISVIIYVISYNIWPLYNGTRVHLVREPQKKQN